MLNALDGTVGDGDLGITLLKAFRELDRIKDELPDDLGAAFMKGAGAVSKVSSSSFGTLLATGLIAAGKETKGVTAIPASEVSRLLERAGATMAARGRSSLGDKTVLDTLAGAARAAEGKDDLSAMFDAVREAVDGVLDEYRDKPNRIGRARIFGDRTIGLDDPGMVAFKIMVDALSPAR